MKASNYFDVGKFVIWRAIQSIIVIPTSIIGTLIFFLAIAGQSPIQDSVIHVYRWAEIAVRPASAGNVFVVKCENVSKVGVKPTLVCSSTQPKLVPIATFAESFSRSIKSMYFTLVILSVAMLLVAYPGRVFIGLKLKN